MRTAFVFLFCLASFCSQASAQETLPRDARAVTVLQQSVLAMGGIVPADSVATGQVTLVEGSKTETSKFRVLTRGASQTAEVTETSDGTEAVVYSSGNAASKGATVKPLQLELAVSSQSGVFPMVVLAEAPVIESEQLTVVETRRHPICI